MVLLMSGAMNATSIKRGDGSVSKEVVIVVLTLGF